MIQQMIDKVREISEGNMREILAYRSDLRDVRARFKSMFAEDRATGQDVRAELAAITQTDQNQDRFFVGDADDYFHPDGSPNQVLLLKRLDEIECVIQRRLQRLEARQSGEWVNELERKLFEVMRAIDLITAQYAQGSQAETLIETTSKKLSDVEKQMADHLAELGQVRSEEQLEALKEKLFGPESQQLTLYVGKKFRHTLFDVPCRAIRELRQPVNPSLDLKDATTIACKGGLLLLRGGSPVKVSMVKHPMDEARMTITEL